MSHSPHIATPTFPKGFPPPPTLTSPLRDPARLPTQLDGPGSYTHATSSNSGVGPFALSRASPSTSAPDGAFTSLNHSFSHPPLGVTLDEEQRRCVNTAFHISFHGNPRVKHKPTCVDLSNGASFLIVDRFVSGNSDGVYEKNKKMWEQIPVGQARVFARSAPSIKAVDTDRVGGGLSMREALLDEEAATPTGTRQKPMPLSSSSRMAQVPPSRFSPATSTSSPTTQTLSTTHANGEWFCVASAVGLRKMGHWREANTVYSLHKAVAKSAVALEKVDGEPGQVTAFSWKGERYWVIGCRYQHIVTRLDVPEADLVRYATASSTASSSSAASTSSSAAELSAEAAPPVASPVESPTTPFSGVARDPSEHRRTQSSSATVVTTLTSGGVTSEAGYLDLAVRMARLWRRVLESLPSGEGAAMEKNACERAVDAAGWRAAVALHSRVACDRRTLCFDAILSGWERLQTFSALHSFTPDASDDDSGTCTPVSSSCSPRTTQPATSTILASPSLTASTWETEIPLWFYAVTWDAALDARGWCMPVQRARRFFVAANLPFVPTSTPVDIGSPEYEALRQAVLSRCDTAGAVLYGSNISAGATTSGSDEESDDDDDGGGGEDGAVVQVWKCRAYPHTLERVVQEYVVTHRLCGDPLRNKMKKKVSSLSRETRLYIKQWELHRLPFLVDFALWLHREKYITPSTDLIALKNIRGHWLSYQEKFKDVLLAQLQRQQQRLGARFSSLSTLDVSRKEERVGDEGGEDANSEAAQSAEDSVDPIMLVGPQGCGKSTMARILYALLEEAGAAPRWLNQDEVGTRTAYLAAIRRAMSRGTYSHLLLDKMNLDDKARADYGDIGVKPVLVVAWRHPSGTEAMVHACYDRVVQRGAGHRTFFHAATPAARPAQPPSPSLSSRSPELRASMTPPAEVASPISAGSLPAAWLSAASSPTLAPSLSPSPILSVSADGASRPALSSASSRLHGILEASAKRYQMPASLPCVEVDVTWECKRAVEVVWAALCEKGTCELPPLSELSVDVALQSAYAYERLLEAYPTRVATAVLRGPSSEEVLGQLGSCCPPLIPKALRLQPQVEVVLHDFQLNPSPTALVRYADQIGTTRWLTIQAVVSNPKVVLLLVLGPPESVAADAAAAASAQTHAITTTRIAPNGVLPTSVARTSAATSPTASRDLEDYFESQTQQEQCVVVAKAKKVTVEYCEVLAQRVRDDPEEDPYCSVRWLSPPITMSFTVCFTFP